MDHDAPEGVSIRVDTPPSMTTGLADGTLREYARMVAPQHYPDRVFTGRVLHVGRDEFGPGSHEVVLEVQL